VEEEREKKGQKTHFRKREGGESKIKGRENEKKGKGEREN
jgi:hypothetical protein